MPLPPLSASLQKRAGGVPAAAPHGQSTNPRSRCRRLLLFRSSGKTHQHEHDRKGARPQSRCEHGFVRVDWIVAERNCSGEPGFANVKTPVKLHSRIEYTDRCPFDTRSYIFSAALDIDKLADGVRGHWGVERMHWPLDVELKDDLSRYRHGHGQQHGHRVRLRARPRPLRQTQRERHKEKPQVGTLLSLKGRRHFIPPTSACLPAPRESDASGGAKATLRLMNGMRLVALHLPIYCNVIKSHRRRCSPSAPAGSC
jgi:hypothetical protein